MQRTARTRGFTLVEVLIATTLSSVVMLALISSFLFIGRSLSRLSSYQALENEARKTLNYLRNDFAGAKSVKAGTTPTANAVTLVLAAGEVTYTYDTTAKKLRRQATFGASPDLYLLSTTMCECAAFAFGYYTTTDGVPTDQNAPTTVIPYSVKQIDVAFTLQSPTGWATERRTRFEAASSRFLIRYRSAPDGT